jgi:hypothetical protein
MDIYRREKTMQLLWRPSEERIRNANMTRYGKHFTDYFDLCTWSVENIPDF